MKKNNNYTNQKRYPESFDNLIHTYDQTVVNKDGFSRTRQMTSNEAAQKLKEIQTAEEEMRTGNTYKQQLINAAKARENALATQQSNTNSVNNTRNNNVSNNTNKKSTETVSQKWTRVTGLPWAEAKKRGFTTGSYENNMRINTMLDQGWFNNNNKNYWDNNEGNQHMYDMMIPAFEQSKKDSSIQNAYDWAVRVADSQNQQYLDPRAEANQLYLDIDNQWKSGPSVSQYNPSWMWDADENAYDIPNIPYRGTQESIIQEQDPYINNAYDYLTDYHFIVSPNDKTNTMTNQYQESNQINNINNNIDFESTMLQRDFENDLRSRKYAAGGPIKSTSNSTLIQNPYLLKFQEKVNSTPGYFNMVEKKRNTPASIWENTTGMSWENANKLGYTNGSAKSNLALANALQNPNTQQRLNEMRNSGYFTQIPDEVLSQYLQKVPTSYTPSPEIIEYIKNQEKFIPEIYEDSKKVKTIGYGFTDDDLLKKYKNGITKEQADEEFLKKLQTFSKELESTPNWSELNQNQKDALLSYYYNIGGSNFYQKSPKLQKALRDKNWNEVANQMDFGYDDPLTPGLRTRRDDERALWNTPIN